MLVRTLLGTDLLVALVVYFSSSASPNGSVSSFNMNMWLGLLAAVAGTIGGGWLLNANGRHGPAIAVLSVLARAGRPLRLICAAGHYRTVALELRRWHPEQFSLPAR